MVTARRMTTHPKGRYKGLDLFKAQWREYRELNEWLRAHHRAYPPVHLTRATPNPCADESRTILDTRYAAAGGAGLRLNRWHSLGRCCPALAISCMHGHRRRQRRRQQQHRRPACRTHSGTAPAAAGRGATPKAGRGCSSGSARAWRAARRQHGAKGQGSCGRPAAGSLRPAA